MKSRFTRQKNDTKNHWLDYAEEKCGEKLVIETKMVLNVTKLFLALPLFWAMYSQCNSRWVFQATKMNGDIGFYTIKPDQIVMLPNIFILVMLPTFDYAVYPLMAKIGIRTALQKVTCGFICCLLSFIAAAVIESKINDDSIAMLWLFPQYFILAAAEVFIWVPIVNFAYTEAPERMKSVMTSFVYITVSMGSLIVIIVSGSHFMESQVYEIIMYASAMVVNIVFFVIMSKNYTFVGKSR